MMGSNWDNFLKNLGEWQGSFTQVSLTGELLSSTPSILSLAGSENNALVHLRLRRFGTGSYNDPPSSDYRQDYQTLGRQIIFFDTGAFSKGSLQLAPYSEFGAEYGFVAENRRLRFVQLYDDQGMLNSLTLIREFRQGTDAQERPPLTVDQLFGTWAGTAWTEYADLRNPSITNTHLDVQDMSGGCLQQRLSFGDQTMTSIGRIEGNIIHFDTGAIPRQILLLPDGTSSNTPLQVKLHQPFFVELGWLVSPHEHQRLIRSYNEKGEWVSATHVIERRV